jgi:pimeloyl-ACP methyl ester carboxylesterase
MPLGTGVARRVLSERSLIDVTPRVGQTLAMDQVYAAIVVAVPLPPILVRMVGDLEALDLVRQAMNHASVGGGPSPLVQEARADNEDAPLLLEATPQGYTLRRRGERFPLSVPVEAATISGARRAVEYLEHIARWLSVLQVENRASRLPQHAVRMELFPIDPVTQQEREQPLARDELTMSYHDLNGTLTPPRFTLKLTNTTDQELYCTLLDLPETFGVSAGLLTEGRIKLTARGTASAEAWAVGGRPISFHIPAELRRQGVQFMYDTLKLIVSTADVDGRLLEQPDLGVRYTADQSRGPRADNTLTRLMRRIPARHLAQDDDGEVAVSDWYTSELLLSVALPPAGVPIPKDEAQEVEVAPGLYLAGHSTLSASLRVYTGDAVSRGAGNVTLPAPLRDRPEYFMPLPLMGGRFASQAVSCIEIEFTAQGSATYANVSQEQPLILRTETPLAAGEGMLALAFDGEFFLPLNTYRRLPDGDTEIRLERLPLPVQEDTRSLGGAVRIFIQKVLNDRFGVPTAYPRLALPLVTAGKVSRYEEDSAVIRDALAGARRVLVFIHGIIGDTTEMAARALEGEALKGSASSDTVVLAFDYESLNTKIERTAQDLKRKLGELGLGHDHDKELVIVAHSMGGLVARWFIEKEGGHKVVHRLVMFGTPNGGSPWPTIQDWATTAIGIGVNFIGEIAWPVRVLGWLVAALEHIDQPLDEMKRGSDFLASLAVSDDPGVPYTAIAGNTSLVAKLEQHTGPAGAQSLTQLLQRLAPDKLVHSATAFAFFHEANDIAVSVASIHSVPADRQPPPVCLEIPCDHLTYFTDNSSLALLSTVLR